MCGIVGVIAKRTNGLFTSDVKLFTQMLYADQFRGTDGTGVYNVTSKNAVVIEKEPRTAHYFIARNDKWLEKLNSIDSMMAIGHNRAATKGVLSKENTHPFTENHITLVHNGTLFTHRDLADVEVDSHAICHAFASKGHEKTLQELDGAFALVWYNQKTKRLYLTRNKERPLNLIELEFTWMISSEPGLAKWIAERNNQKVVAVHEIEPEHLYSFDLEDTTKFNKVKVKFKEKKFVSSPAWTGHHNSMACGWPDGDEIGYNYNGKSRKRDYKNQASNPNTGGYTGATSPYPVLTTMYHGAWIGREVLVSPIAIEVRRGVSCLVGTTDSDDTVDVIIHGNDEQLKIWEKADYVRGIVKYRLISGGEEEWTVGDVQTCYRSYNDTPITYKELENIQQCTCDWCSKSLKHIEDPKGIKVVKTLDGATIKEIYCEECSPYAEDWAIYGGGASH